eukprot:646452-Pleurochrysis_carterae.AAC.4
MQNRRPVHAGLHSADASRSASVANVRSEVKSGRRLAQGSAWRSVGGQPKHSVVRALSEPDVLPFLRTKVAVAAVTWRGRGNSRQNQGKGRASKAKAGGLWAKVEK